MAERLSRPLRRLHWFFLAVWMLGTPYLWYFYAATRPKSPHPETGNVYVLNTHGALAYLTFRDCVYLYGLMAIGLGGALVIPVISLWQRGWIAGDNPYLRLSEAERNAIGTRMLVFMLCIMLFFTMLSLFHVRF